MWSHVAPTKALFDFGDTDCIQSFNPGNLNPVTRPPPKKKTGLAYVDKNYIEVCLEDSFNFPQRL